MHEKVREYWAEKAQDERDRGEEKDRDEIEPIEVVRLGCRVGRRILVSDTARAGHRLRLRRLAPPWFCPSRSGRWALISHTTVSASGTGTAMMSPSIRRERKMPRRFLIAASSDSSPRTFRKTAGLSMCCFMIGATMRLRRSKKCWRSGSALTQRIWS